MERTILSEKSMNLGYSVSLGRDLIIVLKIDKCVFCDSQEGLELLVRAEHRKSWGLYKCKDMVEAKKYFAKAVAEFTVNYKIQRR